MSQNFNLIPAGDAFSSVRDTVNTSLAALNSSHSGVTAPASPVLGQFWVNTTNPALPVLNIYNGGSFIPFFTPNGLATFTTLVVTGSATIGTGAGTPHAFHGLTMFNNGLRRDLVRNVNPGALFGAASNWIYNEDGVQNSAGGGVRSGHVALPGAAGSIFKSAQLRWSTGSDATPASVTIELISLPLSTTTGTPTIVATITDTAAVSTAQFRTINFNPADLTFVADTYYSLKISGTPGLDTNLLLHVLQISMEVRN